MKQLHLIFALLACLSGLPVAWGQQLPQVSLYQRNPLQYNSAHAGWDGAARLTGITRTQWAGWEGAPNTQFLSGSAALKGGKAGMGVTLMNDAIGARFHRTARVHGAYHLALNDAGLRVSAGVSVGMESVGIAFTNLYIPDGQDPAMAQPYQQGQIAAGAGLVVHADRWFVSASVPQLLRPAFHSLAPIGGTVRHGFLAFGGSFPLSPSTELRGSALVKQAENAPVTVDLNVEWWLFDILSVGVMGRYGEGFGVQTAYKFKEGVRLHYAVDFPTNGLMSQTFGSHEIGFAWEYGRPKRAVSSPRFF